MGLWTRKTSCAGLMATLPLGAWTRLIGWLAIGVIFYFTYGQGRSVAAAAQA